MHTLKVCAGLLIGALAAATFADDPDCKAILKKADDNTKALKAVHYVVEWFGQGDAMKDAPKINGEVWLERASDPTVIRGAMKGTVTGPDGKVLRNFNVATDGKLVTSIDSEAKTITRGEVPAAMELIGPAVRLHFQEYTHPTPFEQECEGESAKYEGEKKIGDTDCHVIYVVYADGAGESRWYFGKEDYLPRRVDRIIPKEDGNGGGEMVLQVTKLNVKPEITSETLTPATPAGYEEKKHAARARPAAPELLKVGSEAPDWELETPGGEKVSLKSLRGKVVMLDFWATWCGPCKRAMPGVQKLHEQFKDKPVKIIGMNCWERGGDPAKYMKDKGFTYMLLLKADAAAEAYAVSGIPTFYVIGPDGKIAFAKTGASDDEKEIVEAITKALPRDSE